MSRHVPWVQTFPHTPNDGCVRPEHLEERTDVLRVRKLEHGAHAGQWAWFASRLAPTGPDGLRRYSDADGYCDTKKEAHAAAEAFYFRAEGETESGG